MGVEEQLYNLLKETFLKLDAGDRTFFSRYDLTVPRYYALYHIAEAPGISLSQLSDRMLCDKSNVTRIIKGLEMDGLVCRRAHESDGRTLRLFLTKDGTAVHSEVSAAHAAFNVERLARFSPVERQFLVTQLTQLADALEEVPACHQ